MKNMYLYLIVSSLGSPQQKAARNNFSERPFPQFTYTGINGVVLRVTAKNLLDYFVMVWLRHAFGVRVAANSTPQ